MKVHPRPQGGCLSASEGLYGAVDTQSVGRGVLGAHRGEELAAMRGACTSDDVRSG